MKKMFFAPFICLLVVSFTLFGAPAWQTNYDQALQKAKKESKPVVLFFTGSDWCVWCKNLDREVFNTREFTNAAGNDFVFVMLDFPLDKTTDPFTKQQNEQLKNKYQIQGFPTVIILDQNGNVLGRTGYQAGGGAAYARHLKSYIR